MLTEQEKTDINLVLGALTEVVAEAGEDYIYPERLEVTTHASYTGMCWYVWENQPDCIAGRTLHKLGVTVEILKEFEGRPCTRIPTPLSTYALEVLSRAQGIQDGGGTWGHALTETKAKAEMYLRH